MCSTFIHHQNKNYCTSSTNNSVAYSKSQYEAPKQLLQLRSQIKPLILHNHRSDSWDSSSDSGVLSRSSHSPQPSPGQNNQKYHLTYIEKDKRGRQMNSQHQHYQAHDRPAHYHSRKALMTPGGPPPLMRTPSSGFSSASSSENMLSGLTLSDNENRIHEILDPSVEVDLDMFLLPDVRYKQPAVQPSTSTSRNNLSQLSGPSQIGGSMRQIAPYQAKSTVPTAFTDYSYANVKRSNGYTDYMPTTHSVNTVSHPSVSSVPVSQGTWIRCRYCWDSYVKLCQRVANLDPIVSCDGPWLWHSLYDAQGRVACPRLWFAQLDRAGSDMLAQMVHVRNAPV